MWVVGVSRDVVKVDIQFTNETFQVVIEEGGIVVAKMSACG